MQVPYGEEWLRRVLQPWEERRFQLTSWFDMQQFSARAFYLIGVTLEALQLELTNAALKDHLVNQLAFDATIDDASRNKAVQGLGGVADFCESIGLDVSAQTVEDLQREIETKPLSYTAVMVKFMGLGQVISREMKGRMFMYIPYERAQYYGVLDPFGERVAASFGSARFDIAEAGNCLATARGTACVFHLMRVLEIGLSAFYKVLFGSPLEHTNWAPAIEKCESEIKNMNQQGSPWKSHPDCKALQEFYSQAINYLATAKDAWRNYTAHSRGKFTDEEADLMFRNIRAFMQKLAERLSE